MIKKKYTDISGGVNYHITLNTKRKEPVQHIHHGNSTVNTNNRTKVTPNDGKM